MVLTVVIAILFLAVVFFHYLQGFFSATLSAIFSVFAAVLAFSWHEVIVQNLFGKMANVAHSMVLVALFAGIYIALRALFDNLVPNGLMLPAIVDKIGGAVMGVVAAAFALGILTIAAEELPMGPSVASYSKYDTSDEEGRLLISGRSQDGKVEDILRSKKAGVFDENDRKQTFPVVPMGFDELVIDTVDYLSDGGSLSTGEPLKHVHPDFLQEVFAQNIGIQAGASHVVKPEAVTIVGVFNVPQVNMVDGVPSSIRPGAMVPQVTGTEKFDFHSPNLNDHNMHHIQYGKPATGLMLVAVRIAFGPDAADADKYIRLSPGSIRLVANKPKQRADQASETMNYYPIGTLEPGRDATVPPILYANRLDDYLFIAPPAGDSGQPAVDVVFAVSRDAFMEKGKGGWKVADGTFIEVKRTAREKLDTFAIDPYPAVADGKKWKIGTLHQQEAEQVPAAISATRPASSMPPTAPAAP